ncbi:MAG: recombinase family protein [Oscillospiraceae bacterium]|nr:recombinase family protein [Oscillospiraceae bacterium]
MKAYIYGRYSSHRQSDTSIEQQFKDIYEYCRQNDIAIVGEYADRAVSGKTDNRPEFQRMVRDCAKGRVQLVVCWKVDRFARNRYDSAMYKAKLKKHGVRVLYAKEAIPEGPEGILMEAILEGSAEYYSANLSQNVRRGMMANAEDCKVNNGALPLGYCKGADGRFAIDPAGAEIVREIFAMYTNGMKCCDICADLNSRGLRTAHNAQFNKNSLRSVLKNDRYIGVYEYGEVRVEGGVPAIISREVFDLAQDALQRRAKAPAASWADTDYLLTGKLFCGVCGGTMIGESGTSRNGAKHNYYTCSARKRAKTCPKKPVKKDWLEEMVVRSAVEYALSDAMIEAIAENAVRLQKEEQEQGELPLLKGQLKEVQRKLKNVNKAILEGITARSTRQMLEELEQQEAQLKEAIQNVEVEFTHFTKEMLIFWLEKFRGGDVKDVAYQTKIIEAFVSAVYLYEDKLKIVVQYAKNGDDTITLDFVDSVTNGGECSALGVGSPPTTQICFSRLF